MFDVRNKMVVKLCNRLVHNWGGFARSTHASRISATFFAISVSSSRAWAFRGFEFLVQFFELFLEVFVAYGFVRCDADVTAGFERPALRFNFLERGGAAEAGNIAILRIAGFGFRIGGTEHFENLCLRLFATQCEVEGFAAIEADEVGEEADLR